MLVGLSSLEDCEKWEGIDLVFIKGKLTSQIYVLVLLRNQKREYIDF